jgi:prepilin-type N-terminal cleavage/methylation domain-containing protein
VKVASSFRENNRCSRQGGFSLLEMVIASAVLLVGILSVVQLIPASLKANLYNRMDTMAIVVAQRELDQMLNQPLSAIGFTDTTGNPVSLGGPNAPGSPVVMQGSSAIIDFSQSPVDGFNIQGYRDTTDLSDLNAPTFELRWAVFPQTNANGVLIGKRLIVGCRQTNAAQPMLPVSLDTSIQR